MSSALQRQAQAVADADRPTQTIRYGPFAGSMRSVPRDRVPRAYAAAGTEFLYRGRHGSFRRRGGQNMMFDDFGADDGLLPAHWGAKARWSEEYAGGQSNDGIASLMALFTKEENADPAVVDDGKFANIWVRDQVNNANRILGEEYSATTYPAAAGTIAALKHVPLRYASGQGGITRGINEFQRRFMGCGSRRFQKVGNWWYFPAVDGVPFRYNGERAAYSAGAVDASSRVIPSGPLPPLWPGKLTRGAAVAEGPWEGKQRFAHSVAFRFEDGSVWMPCTPRQPNTLNPDGFGIFTVDVGNPNQKYDKLTWTLPARPAGCTGILLLRGLSADASKGEFPEDLYDLRLVWEVKDATTTTYDDYFGSDDAIEEDPTGDIIRFDHIMPPRARYVFAGDMRVCHSYGGLNPCAIMLAPLGYAADYDLNVPDTNAAAWAQYFAMSLTFNLAGAAQLNLRKNATTKSFSTVTYDTLQKLVDAVNATTVADACGQWRAQVVPGVNPDASIFSSLVPHARTIANCSYTAGSKNITSTGSLLQIPVGAYLFTNRVDWTGGSVYVKRIIDENTLEMSDVALASAGAPFSLAFAASLGDTVAGDVLGYQRVACCALPGFLYFSQDFLDQFPLETQSVWMTVASPGQTKSAANNFSGNGANKHTPPLDAGVSQGGVALDNGFVVPFAKKRCVIRNTRDQGTGVDSDYRIFVTNETNGCIGWNTVGGGHRFAHLLGPEGVIACDLFNETLLSDKTFAAKTNDGDALGDFDFEAPLGLASAVADTDAQTACARIMRGVLFVNYRASGSANNRQVQFDFSAGQEQSGLACLVRGNDDILRYDDGSIAAGPGELWGWSLPLLRSMGVMVEGRRADGSHIYAFNDENGGAVGDGRVDEFEVSDLDNGSQIAGGVQTRLERAGLRMGFGCQEISIEQAAPDGSVGSLTFHRVATIDDDYELTLLTSATDDPLPEIKMLPQGARANTPSVYIVYAQVSGAARELFRMALHAKIIERTLRAGYYEGAGYGIDYGGESYGE